MGSDRSFSPSAKNASRLPEALRKVRLASAPRRQRPNPNRAPGPNGNPTGSWDGSAFCLGTRLKDLSLCCWAIWRWLLYILRMDCHNKAGALHWCASVFLRVGFYLNYCKSSFVFAKSLQNYGGVG
jgi:hypothetical protein